MASSPPLSIPSSSSTVSVSIIDTKATLSNVATSRYLHPPVPGHEALTMPSYSFLITHLCSSTRILFDLGPRRDPENLPPRTVAGLAALGYALHAQTDVAEVLVSNGVGLDSVSAIVWSHWHFDHTGDPTRFPPGAALVVGPGFSAELLPGYPADPAGGVMQAAMEGRELREVAFGGGGLEVAGFKAHDYFGDGSFYLLDAPGHAVGHMCGLARVTTDSFVFLGADVAHHMGALRPSKHLPLPETIAPSPFGVLEDGSSCPGEVFAGLLKRDDEEAGDAGDDVMSRSVYRPSAAGHADLAEAERTARKVQALEGAFVPVVGSGGGDDNVLVLLAHDDSLHGVVPFFPHGTVDDFVEKGLVAKTRWRFLRDFAQAVGMHGETK